LKWQISGVVCREKLFDFEVCLRGKSPFWAIEEASMHDNGYVMKKKKID